MCTASKIQSYYCNGNEGIRSISNIESLLDYHNVIEFALKTNNLVFNLTLSATIGSFIYTVPRPLFTSLSQGATLTPYFHYNHTNIHFTLDMILFIFSLENR